MHGTKLHIKSHLSPRFIQNDLFYSFINSITLPLKKYALRANYVHDIMINSLVIDNV